MVFALIGNPNSGKTTLFNTLTGSNQHVGNFPGVTVEQRIGTLKKLSHYASHLAKYSIVDLPGIYSLRPFSQEEIITRDFLLNAKPDGIINIIDATNLERSLYLTLQLLELDIPIIIALNMMDEIKNNSGEINISRLSKELGVPIIPISAIKNEGIPDIINAITHIAKNNYSFTYIPSVHKCIQNISGIIEQKARAHNLPPRFCAIKIIEGDIYFYKKLKLNKSENKLIENIILEMEQQTKLDRNTAIADMRYSFIEKICAKNVIKPKETQEHKYSVKIDKILTNKYLALPIFFIIMFGIFWITFNGIGNMFSEWMNYGINSLTIISDNLLTTFKINSVIHSLIIDGIFSGVGSVLIFLPIIVVLFFFLSILEDTGYMSRIVFITDTLLKKIGLSGKSLVPLLIGFGCSVPAIMATRTLSSKRDRKMTIFLIPYISCSAKLPIYAVFCAAFFEKYAPLVMMGLYILGIVIGIIIALLFKNTLFREKDMSFILELPNYRWPSLKSIFLLMWDKTKEFLLKAFTTIFIATIIIWFLQTFDAKLNIINDNSNSLLAVISKAITPIFMPLGLGDWRIITALLSGLSAKEAVISSLSILLNVHNSELSFALYSLFTPLTAFCFLIFTLLYTPCIAAIATINKELQSPLQTIGMIIFQCIISWIITFLFFKIGGLII